MTIINDTTVVVFSSAVLDFADTKFSKTIPNIMVIHIFILEVI